MSALEIVQDPPLPENPRPIVGIGAGGIVNDAHQPAYAKAGFNTIGLYDLDGSKARATAQRFSIPKVFSSLEEAVANAPEGAVYDVAVPAEAILGILPSLPDGAAILLQKPLGDDFEQAGAIRDLCHRKNLTTAMNFQLRYAPNVLAARSLIDQGAIGELHEVDIRVTVYTPFHLWPFLEDLPRVEILYNSIHYLDLVRSFFGEPDGVYAKTMRHPKMNKLASTRTSMIVDYGDFRRANIATNHGHEFGLTHQESYVKWEGTRGAIKATMGLNMNYPAGEPDAFDYCLLAEGEDPQWHTLPLEGSWLPDAFIGTMASLMRYLEGSASTLPTSIDDGYRTMALVEAAHRSSDGGGTAIPRAGS